MKLVEKDENIVLVDDNGNVVSPQDPAAISYIVERYNFCIKDMRRLQDDLKKAGIKSVDQLDKMSNPDADINDFFNNDTGRSSYYHPGLYLDKDFYLMIQHETDLIRRYISANNIDYGTVDENGFIVKKNQER